MKAVIMQELHIYSTKLEQTPGMQALKLLLQIPKKMISLAVPFPSLEIMLLLVRTMEVKLLTDQELHIYFIMMEMVGIQALKL
jgi:hypothetical protein